MPHFPSLYVFCCRLFPRLHQTKKWKCKLCGEAQSVRKIFFKGTGKDCRTRVQALNLRRGEMESISAETAMERDYTEYEAEEGDAMDSWHAEYGDSIDNPSPTTHAPEFQTPKQSKWDAFVERPQEGEDDEEEDVTGVGGVQVTTDATQFSQLLRDLRRGPKRNTSAQQRARHRQQQQHQHQQRRQQARTCYDHQRQHLHGPPVQNVRRQPRHRHDSLEDDSALTAAATAAVGEAEAADMGSHMRASAYVRAAHARGGSTHRHSVGVPRRKRIQDEEQWDSDHASTVSPLQHANERVCGVRAGAGMGGGGTPVCKRPHLSMGSRARVAVPGTPMAAPVRMPASTHAMTPGGAAAATATAAAARLRAWHHHTSSASPSSSLSLSLPLAPSSQHVSSSSAAGAHRTPQPPHDRHHHQHKHQQQQPSLLTSAPRTSSLVPTRPSSTTQHQRHQRHQQQQEQQEQEVMRKKKASKWDLFVTTTAHDGDDDDDEDDDGLYGLA
ncbi:hypothetical protein PTSG_04544 [Salpingoeca rosetta]|uniref:MRN complex-interacting protein N-terminal domain-containing protein n=1 Tax=Salpingoeca rosetta (strain ATCC 50818 / BSB-021) TaxID=946362 RepID=F2U7R2_SALR5|nr:uncharacterized protein PTSG_04544 [Salpingoeca rosetta]EGD72817.1 hypothetical protein PTSG_04544 [Salpingoeca rosetta]|eukprot:XP_004994640.1 hypothetical protein PTSG_04544 [Salpingoeca rosetta]